MAHPVLGQKDPAHVWMPVELDTEQVEDLALLPQSRRPQRYERAGAGARPSGTWHLRKIPHDIEREVSRYTISKWSPRSTAVTMPETVEAELS